MQCFPGLDWYQHHWISCRGSTTVRAWVLDREHHVQSGPGLKSSAAKASPVKNINERAPTVSPPLELLLQVVNRFLSKIKALVMSLLRVLGLLARGFEASSLGVFSECLSLMPLDTRALLSIAQFCPVATHSNSLAAQKAFSLEHHLKREVC